MKCNFKNILKFFGKFSFTMAKDIVLLDFFNSISDIKMNNQLSFLNILAIALISFGVTKIVVTNVKLYRQLNGRGDSSKATPLLFI